MRKNIIPAPVKMEGYKIQSATFALGNILTGIEITLKQKGFSSIESALSVVDITDACEAERKTLRNIRMWAEGAIALDHKGSIPELEQVIELCDHVASEFKRIDSLYKAFVATEMSAEENTIFKEKMVAASMKIFDLTAYFKNIASDLKVIRITMTRKAA